VQGRPRRATRSPRSTAYGRLTLTLRSPSEEAFASARTTDALLAALAGLQGAASDRVALMRNVLAKRRALAQQAELRGCESEWTAEVQRTAKQTLSSLREPAGYVPRSADADDASALLPGLVIDEQLLALLPAAPAAGAPLGPAAERAELLRALAAARAESAAARTDAQRALADCKAAGAALYHDALLLADQSFGFSAIRDALEREERTLASATDVPTLEAEVALTRERLSAAQYARAQLAERVSHAEALAHMWRQAAERGAASRPKAASARRLDADEQREMAERLSTKPVAAARKAQPLLLVWHGASAPPTLRAIAARLGEEQLKGRELVSLFNLQMLTPLQAQQREVLVPTSCHGVLRPGAVRLTHLTVERPDLDDDYELNGANARADAADARGSDARGADVLSSHDERVIARPGLPVYLTLRGFSSLAADDALLVLVARPVDALAKRTQLAAVVRRERLHAYAAKTNNPRLAPVARMTSEQFAKDYAQRLRKHADVLRATQKSWGAEQPARRIPWRQLEASIDRLSAGPAAGGADAAPEFEAEADAWVSEASH
jgi:hypothetical protein